MLSGIDLDNAAMVLTDAAENIARDLAAGDVAGEEDFTCQMLGEMKPAIRNLKTPSSTWSTMATDEPGADGMTKVRIGARQLTSKSPGAEES